MQQHELSLYFTQLVFLRAAFRKQAFDEVKSRKGKMLN